MSIKKRGGIYHIDFAKPGGGRVRCTTGTEDRRKAQEYHDKLKQEYWRVLKLGEKQVRTYEEAAVRFLREQAGKSDYANKERYILYFGGFFAGRDLNSITRTEIFDALPVKYSRGGIEKPLSTATRNRYLASIRGMLNDAAEDWEWIDKAPSLKTSDEGDSRIRWITQDEARRLIDVITVAWMRDMVIFSLATGLRQANVYGLEWSQLDLVKRRAWIHPDQAKAGKAIGVPLNADAVAAIRRNIGKHSTYVFVRNGKLLPNMDWKQWKKFLARANISDFRWHDLRHTWASWHVQAGTPLDKLKEMGGWATFDMVLRYAHLAPDHLAAHADAVSFMSQAVAAPKSGTSTSHDSPDFVPSLLMG